MMGILVKLCCRDLIHRKLRMCFTVLAIAAVSCLMIWFVGSLDMTSMIRKDVVKNTFGEYSLAMFHDDGFSSEDIEKLSASELVERLDQARQTDPEISLAGVEFVPGSFRSSPKITGIDRINLAPYAMDEGDWFSKSGECVVSSIAEETLLRGNKEEKEHIEIGQKISVKTDAGETFLTVVGTFKQTAMEVPKGAKRGPSGTFSFGFGEGLGTSNAPKSKSPASQPQSASPAGRMSPGKQKFQPETLAKEENPQTPPEKKRPQHTAQTQSSITDTASNVPLPSVPQTGKRNGRKPGAAPEISSETGNERRKAIRGPWSPQEVGLSAPAIYVSLNDLHKISGTKAASNLLFIQLKKGKTPSEFFTEAEKILGKSLEELKIEKADAVTLQAAQDQKNSINSIFAQAWSTMGIVIVTAILIIFTTLNMDVSERTRYLAMLRTLGLTRTQVAWLILLEGVFLGILGWFFGTVTGWCLLEWLAFKETGTWVLLELSKINLFLAFICTLAGALIASIVPAIRATWVSPVESMVRKTRRFTTQKLLLAAFLGLILLAVMPLIVFLPSDPKTRAMLFGKLGTFCFGFGFLLFFPWTIAITEKLGAPILAFLLRFDPRFLKNQLAGNQLRSLMTALIMSMGLGLFTAILIWSSSMLYRFIIQDNAIPFALVRIDDSITSDEAENALRNMTGVNESEFMEIAVAQPALDAETGEKMKAAGAMNPSVVLMGIDPEKTYSESHPLLQLQFTEGNREKVRQAMTNSTKSPRVCVVTTEISEHAGLHVGDSLRFALPGNHEKPVFADYEIIGVVDFPGMLWFTKFGNVRVGAGRCCAMAFAPFSVVQNDFNTPDNEFFWFNADNRVKHADLAEELKKVTRDQIGKNFLPETDAEFETARFAQITNASKLGISEIPEMLLSLHPGAVTRNAAFSVRDIEKIKEEDLLYVNSARAAFTNGGAAILYGLDPQIAFRLDNPILKFQFKEGSAADTLKTLCDDGNSCVITEEFARARNLKPGDILSFVRPQNAETPAIQGMSTAGMVEPQKQTGKIAPPTTTPENGPPKRRGPGMGGPGMRRGGEKIANIELRIAAIIELPKWKSLAENSGSLMRRNVETVIFTPPSVVKEQFGGKEFQNYWISLKNSSDFTAVEGELQEIAKASALQNREKDALARRDMVRQMKGAQIASIESINASLNARAGNVIGMMQKMPLIMLVISTIAILNTMIVSVFTRRWEMGVLRACGVTRGGLMRMILAESVLIGFCAIVMSFLFGVFYSWLLIHVTSMFGVVTPPLIIPWNKIAYGFGLAVFLCVIASLYPAFITGRKEPVELLRKRS